MIINIKQKKIKIEPRIKLNYNVSILPLWGIFWFDPPPFWKFQVRLILSFENFGL